MSAPLAFVTGATGAVGPAVVARLLAEGYCVRALVRPGRAATLPPTVEPLVGTLEEGEALARGVEGAALVIHLAARLHLNDPDPRLRAEYERTNVGGSARLAEAARAAGVPRFLLASTIAVYGASAPGERLDEGSPLRPATLYAETKVRAEEAVRAHCPAATILRLAAVYGPGMRGNYPRLATALRRGLFVPVGDGRNRRTLVHVEDVAAGMVLVAHHPVAPGETFNLTDGGVHEMREIIAAMAAAQGKRPPRLALPLAPLRAVTALADGALSRVRQRPRLVPLLGKLVEDVAVSGEKMQRLLGFAPCYATLHEGWAQTLGEPVRLQRGKRGREW